MRKLFAIASLVALTLASCANEEPKSGEKGEGRVSIACNVTTDVVDTRANISCTTPAEEDFTLRIEGVNLTYAADYASVAAFAENNYLKAGTYRAIVKAGDIAEEGYDKAAFVGSADFTIEAREDKQVDITATIANALVKVEVTDNFKTYFPHGHSLTLTTAAGNEFDVTEQTEPLFIAPESFTITGTGTKQPNISGGEGLTVELGEHQGTSLKAQTLYTVKLDVEGAGEATLTITLNDEPIGTVIINEELNDYADKE